MDSEVPNKGGSILAATIVFLCLITLVASMRTAARLLQSGSGPKFWWDDYAAFAALPFLYSFNSVAIHFVHIGLGRHIRDVEQREQGPKSLLIHIYVMQLTYIPALMFAKFSVLFFYARVFQPVMWLKKALYALFVLVVAWALTATFQCIFGCVPVDKYWDDQIPGHCIDPYTQFMINAIPNVVTDIFILAVPLPCLWQLQTGIRRKIAITCVFILGYSVVLVSVIRLAYVVKYGADLDADFTWTLVPTFLLIIIEPDLAFVAACIPSCMSFFRWLFAKVKDSRIASSKTKFNPSKHHHHHQRSPSSSQEEARKPIFSQVNIAALSRHT